MFSRRDGAPLRVDSFSTRKRPEVRKARCTSRKGSSPLGTGALSPLSCLGTVGPLSLEDLHCSAPSTASQGSCAKQTSLLELCIHCVQFSYLTNPLSRSAPPAKCRSKLRMEEDLFCVDFCIRKKLGIQTLVPFKKKVFLILKRLGFPPPCTT